ncbi:FxSxx-COOH system tetratricopeptide repeat protein [Actinoplanes sp. HUAS TT8]|uniref:FxSxx-COOH system tetratricopeptide repeat protein n=1 Tax=Actinoplanes sp. HUAS TT8 TaxID=3447453 RepID=UPI003F527DAE
MLDATGPRRLHAYVVLGAAPIVVAAGSWLTNVLTSGWNPWLFAALAAVVGMSSFLTVAAERHYRPPETVTTASPAPQALSRPSAWLDVPPRSRHFTGRDELLATLGRVGAEETRGLTAIVPHALYGLGGVGKTHLAIEYAHRNRDRYDLVAWIPAEQPALMRSAFLRIAAAMGLPESDDLEQTVELVRGGLQRGTPFRSWLIVFDNAEEPVTLRPYLPEPAPPHSAGRVLITSRDRTWSSLADTIEVEVLHRHESVALLRKRNPNVSDTDATTLAERLGDLPLALEQASAWIDASGMRISDYLRLLSEHTQELLGANRPADYPTSVAATWGVALDRLSTTDPVAVELLELSAFLGPEPIDRRLLGFGGEVEALTMLKAVLVDPMRLDRAMAHIGKLSLVKFDSARGTIQLHRLVRAVIRARLSPEQRERLGTAAQMLLAAADASVPDTTGAESWWIHAMITPHLRYTGCLASADGRIQELVLRHLNYLYARRDTESCQQLAEKASAAWTKRLGPGHANTLHASVLLATAARELGRTDFSKRLLEEVLGRARRTLGESHPVTLRAANSYGADLRLIGDYRRAHQLDLVNLDQHQAVYGPADARTFQMTHNVAVDLRSLGRFAEALALDEKNRSLLRRTCGVDDLRTIYSGMACVLDLYYLGRYQEALTQAQSVAAEMTGLVGSLSRHPLLESRIQAIVLAAAGQSGPAEELSQQILDKYRTIHGYRHPQTLAMAMTAANIVRHHRPRMALSLANATLAQHEKTYGGEHPATIVALINTAAAERINGEHAEASRHDDQALRLADDVFGAEHWITLCARQGRAINRSIAGDHGTSYHLMNQVYQAAVALHGADHPYTLTCAANLVKAAGRAKRHGAAQPLRAQLSRRLAQGDGGNAVLLRRLRDREWVEFPVELPPY